MFARIINDWGSEFEVIDKDGEQIQEIMVKHIDNNGIVKLLSKHELQDSDVVVINNVIGMVD